MKMSHLKNSLAIAIILLSSLSAFARGSEGRGGGDPCEDRIKIVRDDLNDWIYKGGPAGLILEETSADQYSQAMLPQISKAKIRCVGAGDTGYPVAINNTPKVCRFDKASGISTITCDFAKFQSMSQSDQYVLVHHEYAGLAGLELPNGADSNYAISNQIPGFLTNQTIKKLTLNPNASSVQITKTIRSFLCNGNLVSSRTGETIAVTGQMQDFEDLKENTFNTTLNLNSGSAVTPLVIEGDSSGALADKDPQEYRDVIVTQQNHNAVFGLRAIMTGKYNTNDEDGNLSDSIFLMISTVEQKDQKRRNYDVQMGGDLGNPLNGKLDCIQETL